VKGGEVGRRWQGEAHEYARGVLMRPQSITHEQGVAA